MAEEAVAAAAEIGAEVAVMRLGAAQEVGTLVAVDAEDAFVQFPRSLASEAVTEVLVVAGHHLAKVAVLRTVDCSAVVAVLCRSCACAVLAVLTSFVKRCHLRNGGEEFGKLFEEWAGEVELSPISQRIPRVAPPFINGVDGVGLVRSVEGEDGLSGEGGFPLKEHKGNLERRSSLMPAVRAHRGFRNIKLPEEFTVLRE